MCSLRVDVSARNFGRFTQTSRMRNAGAASVADRSVTESLLGFCGF